MLNLVQHYLKHKLESNDGRDIHENIHVHTYIVIHMHTHICILYIIYYYFTEFVFPQGRWVYHMSFCNCCYLLVFQDERCNLHVSSISAEGSRLDKCSFISLSPMKKIKTYGQGDVPAKHSYFHFSPLTNTCAQGGMHSSQFVYLVAS